MRFISILALVLSFQVASAAPRPPVHLDLDASGHEYQSYLRSQGMESVLAVGQPASAIDQAIDLGNRNLAWLVKINAGRDAANKLSFSNKANTRGIPITAPNRYSPAIIEQKYLDVVSALPADMGAVLLSSGVLPDQIPASVTEDVYLTTGLAIDRVYQSALRWEVMKRWLDYYADLKRNDIRGIYFLNLEIDLETKLKTWSQQSQTDQARLYPHLVGMCMNLTGTNSSCGVELDLAIGQKDVFGFYTSYKAHSQGLFDSYFEIQDYRSDINWKPTQADVLSFPFQTHKSQAIMDFLKKNIEEEWKFGSWKLILNFLPSALAHVEFLPNVTPHVDGLAGNKITMDSNSPLTEWDVQWTIRHEFGHVLGFPDCYVEFYDEAAREMVNYQIDVDNLMCSRRGRLQQAHYTELARAYLK